MWFEFAVFVFTDLASVYTLYLVCGILVFHAWWRGNMALSFSIGVASIGCGLSVVVLKEWLAIPRPPDPLITVDTYAFPSGHATGAIFLTLLVWWYVKYVVGKEINLLLTSCLLITVIAVGLSRILFQVHTVEQVLSGYFLGMAWAGLVFLYWYYINKFSLKN